MAKNVRALATDVLTPLLQNKGSLTLQLNQIEPLCPERDRALLRELCYGVMRFHPRLNAILSSLQHRPFKFRDLDIKALALIGLYQLYQTRIPAHAAISESVEACKQLGKPNTGKLVNAILRNFQRQQDEILTDLDTDESFRFNHPGWMVAKLKNNWPEHWQAILEANNQQGPLTLRVNRLQNTRSEYLTKLQQAGITAEATNYSTDGIRLAESVNVMALPGYVEGEFSVQDEAAQLSAQLLDLQPGQRVLDCCAAPGGKLCHILEHQPQLASVQAIELEKARLPRIYENLKRLKLQADVIQADASAADWWDGQQYDRILLDAPCSATGVIRRNPDIKFLRQGEDIHTLAKIQEQILNNVWAMLAPGGKLLYATCSIFPQENEKQLQRFLQQNSDANSIKLEADWGIGQQAGRQLFPQAGEHDGFYYALLQKTG